MDILSMLLSDIHASHALDTSELPDNCGATDALYAIDLINALDARDVEQEHFEIVTRT